MMQDEANAATEHQQLALREGVSKGSGDKTSKLFIPRDALMARANSLKKAVRSVLDMTEREIETQAEVTAEVHTLMHPFQEEPPAHAISPNLSPYSSHSSIDWERRESFDAGPQSLDFFEPRSSMDSVPCDSLGARGSVDSGQRGMEFGLQDGTESGQTRQNRPSVTSLVSVVEPAP